MCNCTVRSDYDESFRRSMACILCGRFKAESNLVDVTNGSYTDEVSGFNRVYVDDILSLNACLLIDAFPNIMSGADWTGVGMSSLIPFCPFTL